MKKSKVYINKNIDVDVDVCLDIDDIQEFIDECSEEEKELIVKYINGSGGDKKESLADSYRMDLCVKLYKNLNEKEIEEIIKKHCIH